MRRPLHLLALLLLVASCSVIAACGEDEDSSGGSTSSESTPAAKKIKVGLVTDIGGLNDRSFNQLANEGLERSKSELGVEGRVLISAKNSDYVPNLSSLAQQKYDLVIGVGFLMAEAMNTVASKFPQTKFAIIDSDATPLKSKPKNVAGLLFKEQEAGYLAGYVAGLYAKDEGADTVELRRRREDPAGRPLHRRLPGRRQGRQPGHQDAQRLLPGLRRPGEVQGARAQPDRRGIGGRVPGRRPVRPRRTRRGQGEEHAGRRRGRRSGLSR